MSLLKSLMARGAAVSLAAAVAVSCALPTAAALAQDAAGGAVPAAAPAAPGTVQVENPYGVEALWAGGDFVARGTLVVLIIMSVSTWYVMITKLVEQGLLLSKAKKANATFWKAKTIKEGAKTLDPKSPFYFLAASGLEAVEHHEGSLVEKIDLNTWVGLSIQRSVEQIISRLQGGLAVLATVGSISPFVGLFGTVMGIYKALTAIGVAGQASIDKVAGPVCEALIMTAFGLFVAVPAVLAYNWLVRRNKQCVEQVRAFSADLHNVLLSGGNI
jgi:biopolymer transport protein ExbB